MEIVHYATRTDDNHRRLRVNENYPWAIDVWTLTNSLEGITQPHKADIRQKIHEWAAENIGYLPEVRLGYFYFKDRADAITFKLRWG